MLEITTNCPECGGKFKESKQKYVIKTRDERRKVVTIENLPVLECTICPHVEIPESSDRLIDNVKDMVKVAMASQVQKEKYELDQKTGVVSNLFKRFIS